MLNIIFSTFVLQLWLAATALAAPVDGTVTAQDAWQYGTGGGIIGLIVLILDIIVFVEVLQSSRSPASKLIWSLVVFFFPIIGMIIYWVFSNRAAHKRGAGYDPIP